MNVRITHTTLLSVLMLAAVSCGDRFESAASPPPPIRFEEVSRSAGLDQAGPSFGAAWGFFNGDAYPDLWVNHHQFKPSLFLNRGDGRFTDVIDLVWDAHPRKDTHGAAWGDFDNDGDQDLLETSGGLRGFMEQPDPKFGNNLYVNDGGRLTERARELGLAFPITRGRHALWVDLTSDGLLDATLSNIDFEDRSFIALRQNDLGFEDITEELGMTIPKISIFSSLADVTGDGALDLLVHSPGYPAAVYDLGASPPRDVAEEIGLPVTDQTKDVVLADFDGDLRTDLYIVRYDLRSSQWIQREENRLQVHLFEDRGKEAGISFEAPETIELLLEPAWKYGVTTEKIYIGSGGFHPDDVSFSLSSADERNQGIAPHRPGEDMGIYVGFEPATGRWKLLHSKASDEDMEKLTGHVEAEGAIKEIEPIGFHPGGGSAADRLFLNLDGGFENRSDAWGLSRPNACHTGVAADFDNDMDQDLYLVCTGVIGNTPNVLLENLDGREFRQVEGAGGATGTTLGVGDSVAAADYDNDGFVDLFVTNGFGPTPFNDGPQQLFHNAGNDHHWIQLRLIGTISNRDAVGARVVLTTPDGRRQLREQGGGVHWKSQNDQRIHFGLGPHPHAQSIEIRWPSGLTQELRDVAGDRILEVTEGEVDGVTVAR